MPLLKSVWDVGEEAGAKIFFTWSSIDLTAMASYMKLGMLPGYQNFFFDGIPQQLPDLPSGYEVVALEKSTAMELDQYVRGAKRQADHDFWLSNPNLQGKQVTQNGKVIGYYYLNRGVIGPVAWKHPADAELLLTLACRDASALAAEIRIAVPGINHAAVRFVLGRFALNKLCSFSQHRFLWTNGAVHPLGPIALLVNVGQIGNLPYSV